MGGAEAREHTRALYRHGDFPLLKAAGLSLFIQQIDRHEGSAPSVRGQSVLIRADAQLHSCARCVQGKASVLFAVGVADGQQLAGFIGQRKGGLMLLGRFAAQGDAVQEELHFLGGGKHVGHACFTCKAGPGPAVDGIKVFPVVGVVRLAETIQPLHSDHGLPAQAVGDLAQIAHRAAISVEIDISAVGQTVGIPALLVPFGGVVIAGDARLAQVIIARPGEVAENMVAALGDLPQPGDLGGIGLAAYHDALRVGGVFVFMAGGEIVIAYHVQLAGHLLHGIAEAPAGGKGVHFLPLHLGHGGVERLTAGGFGLAGRRRLGLGHRGLHLLDAVGHGQKAVDGPGHIAGAVQRAQEVCHLPAAPPAAAAADLRDLIAEAVKHHAGVVIVLSHQALDAEAPFADKVQGVIRAVFRHFPDVRELVHHQDAEAVAGIQQGLARRMMGRADGVETRRLQLPHAKCLRVRQRGRADKAVIVVDAGAAELRLHPVDAQAVPGVQTELADAEAPFGAVQERFSVQKLCLPGVERRVLRTPELGVIHDQAQVGLHRLRLQDGDQVLRACLPPVRGGECQTQTQLFGFQTAVFDRNVRQDQGIAVLQLCRGQAHTLRLNMHERPLMQPYIPVNPGAGVPAGVVLRAAGDDLQHVLLPIAQARIQICAELRITVMVGRDQFAVQVHHGLCHDALEFQGVLLFLPLRGREEALFVGIGLHRVIAGLVAAGCVRAALLQDHGVLGQRDGHSRRLGAEDHAEGIGDAGPHGPAGMEEDLVHGLISCFFRCCACICYDIRGKRFAQALFL